MGLIYVQTRLSNPVARPETAVTVRALVDTGASYLCLPHDIVQQLGLGSGGTKRVKLANGQWEHVPYAGPVRVRLDGHECFVGALVMSDEPILGAMPLQDMSVAIYPAQHRIAVAVDEAA